MVIISIMCFLFGVCIAFKEIKSIIKNKYISIMNCSKFMYSFVYGFFPSIIYIRIALGITTINSYNIDNDYFLSSIIFFIFSIIGYIFLSYGYKTAPVKKKVPSFNNSVLLSGGIVLLILGWLSLILWTKAAGGIQEFIYHADGIRAGYYKLDNPFAFLENITKILLFSLFLIFIVFIQKKIKGKILLMPFLVLSAIGSFLFISAWDSRATIGFCVLSICFIYIDYLIVKKNQSPKKKIISLTITCFGVFLLIIMSPKIMNGFRGISTNSIEFTGISTILEKEFGYIFTTQNYIIDNMFTSTFPVKIFDDFINSITAWIPKRFIPFNLPDSIWRTNTLLILSTISKGTIPTDIISCSIYSLWLPGIIIIPYIFGLIIKKIDSYLTLNNYSPFASVIRYSFAIVAINSISHFQFSSLVKGSFYIVFSYFVVIFISKIKKN